MPSHTAGDEPQTPGTSASHSSSTSIHYRPHTDPRSSHQQIAALVRELAGAGFAPVLDVGCAQGMLGRLLDGSGIEIDGVEPNPAWAELARPNYRNVWTASIEQAPLEGHRYRLIVCGDVLEHLADPVAALRRLRQSVAGDARFIISVPNVAHLAVRLMLLAGRFPRMQRGILDRTHLQFWTRATASKMLADAGLTIQRVSVSGVPLDELWKRGEGSFLFNTALRAQHALLDLLPGLFGYQLIFLASAGFTGAG